MTIQDWHTTLRLEYAKCNFPSQAADRLQRDIFINDLNESFKAFRSDVISRENFVTLTFAQVVTKARDFEAGLKTESAITKHQISTQSHTHREKYASFIFSPTKITIYF